jgi:hypothetical protein
VRIHALRVALAGRGIRRVLITRWLAYDARDTPHRGVDQAVCGPSRGSGDAVRSLDRPFSGVDGEAADIGADGARRANRSLRNDDGDSPHLGADVAHASEGAHHRARDEMHHTGRHSAGALWFRLDLPNSSASRLSALA